MSQLYRPGQFAGQSYMRTNRIEILNPAAHLPPTVVFHEERVLEGPTGVLSRFPEGQCRLEHDPDLEIPLLNPMTGEPIGQNLTMMELYAIVYSVYLHAATARDAAAEIEEPAE